MTILIVEDDPISSERAAIAFDASRGGDTFRVERCRTLEEARRRLAGEPVDAVLLDLGLPDSRGLATLEAIQSCCDAPIVVLSALDDEAASIEAVRRGAQDYIFKSSFEEESLPRAVQHARERHRLIQEVRRRERELAISEATFASIVDKSPDGTIVVDEQGAIRFVNETLVEIGNHDVRASMGQTVPGLSLVSGEEMDVTLRGRGRCRAELFVAETDWSGHPARVVTFRDVTARKSAEQARARDFEKRVELERQLVQAQKMEAVAQLAGGIAHDFNNLLTVILSHCEDLLEDLPTGDRRRTITEAIIKDAQRSAAIARQLTTFGRREIRRPAVYDLREIVGGVEEMLRQLLDEDVQLEIVCGPGDLRVDVDRGQIEQVLLNLVVNARDAMPKGGHLSIHVGREEDGETGGTWMTLVVTDTGTGMDEETRQRAFEPFFTTKPEGKGTGLGLSTVHGIVEQSRGRITVESDPGKGSQFTIRLPMAQRRSEPTDPLLSSPFSPRGDETILLVEDDDAVRYLVGHTLRKKGYSVIEAPHGGDALLIAENHPGNIDLLLTDVVMPETSGREVANRLHRIRPSTKVLFMSGHTNDAVLRHGILEGQNELMVKPFTPATLAQTVRRVLDGAP